MKAVGGLLLAVFCPVLGMACDDAGVTSDGGADLIVDARADSGVDGAADAPDQSCVVRGKAFQPGERYPAGDGCNFCDCRADGQGDCTSRTCPEPRSTCQYAGQSYPFGQRFPSQDGCNECVCAASGLACTRRSCQGALEEGAILLESLDEPCGPEATFTGQTVLDYADAISYEAPFAYERERALYPERRPDTTLTLRVAYLDGFVVCRIPKPDQEAIDIGVFVEWVTADGAFDEGFHTYLRRRNKGFVDAAHTLAAAPHDGLHGTYRPECLDPGALTFEAEFSADGALEGSIHKTCETDISLPVGEFSLESSGR